MRCNLVDTVSLWALDLFLIRTSQLDDIQLCICILYIVWGDALMVTSC